MSKFEQLLTQIAQNKLGIETLETRRSDSLDFHDVAVWCLRDALEAAFNAGLEQGRNANHKNPYHKALKEIREIGDRVTVLKDGRTAAVGLPARETPTSTVVALMTGWSTISWRCHSVGGVFWRERLSW